MPAQTETTSPDYDTMRRSFSWPRPDRFNFARDAIDHWATEKPDARALIWTDDSGQVIEMSFAQVSEASRKTASLLASHGVRRGDRVLIILSRQLAWWETMTACLRIGAVAAPGTILLTAKDIAYRIKAAGAVAIVTDPATAARVDRVTAQCPTLRLKLLVGDERDGWIHYEKAVAAASPQFETADTAADEEALCYFTSGTTGFPKMAMHSHSYPLGHMATGRYWLDLKPDALLWNISDTGWVKAAWSSYFAPWLLGNCIFIHHTPAFDPKTTLEILGKYPITTLCGAPTVYRMLVLENLSAYRFPHLRHCVGAGEPLNPEVISIWRKATGLTIRDGYGQTETALLCGNFPSVEVRPGSMGKPAPGIELAIVDDAGTELAMGEEGNIAVRTRPEWPQGLFVGYKGDSDRTAACFAGDWYLTGDRAMRDADGYFWFIGRADDVILSAGYRIGPFEVESALLEHPAVAESAVTSSPDPTRGEVVKAFVILAPGHKPSDALASALQTHVKAVTAPYKYPRKIEFVESLPKTASGKIRRMELRQQEWQTGKKPA